MVEAAIPAIRSTPGHETLGELFMSAERSASPGGARIVLRTKSHGEWEDIPAWRFFRQVVRIGLFLRERASLQPGDGVLVLSSLRPERLVTEWAVVAQSGIVATLDPGVPENVLVGALRRIAPRIALVEGARLAERVRKAGTSVERFVVIDGPVAAATDVSWSAALDLGGTLDTAERAQAFRAVAKAIVPDAPALAYADRIDDGPTAWKIMTHAEIVRALAAFSAQVPPRAGQVACAIDAECSAKIRIALWALVADGQSTLALGTPADVDELRPTLVVGPVEALKRIRAAGAPRARPGGSRVHDVMRWLERTRAVAALTRRLAVSKAPRQTRLVTLDGLDGHRACE